MVRSKPATKVCGCDLSYANFDFYKIDPGIFAPATFAITNIKTGITHTAGKINPELLKQTMQLAPA
ncbi:MAG TPA: methenyltetrahydromethanopterin cyclohydrolase [Candidatus Acidoferrales bacterium]|nr:methenyltetrahydromethanopterin cyclohydrolase [Candidatus Acidoferrales bacterium]